MKAVELVLFQTIAEFAAGDLAEAVRMAVRAIILNSRFLTALP